MTEKTRIEQEKYSRVQQTWEDCYSLKTWFHAYLCTDVCTGS